MNRIVDTLLVACMATGLLGVIAATIAYVILFAGEVLS